MKPFKHFLTETTYPKFYHGSPVRFNNFDASFLGKGHDQFGPGFYFSNNKSTASRFSAPNNEPYGYVYECDVTVANPIPGDKKISKTLAEKMLFEAEGVTTRQALKKKFENTDLFYESPLSDWDESPMVAFEKLLQSVLNQENAQQSMQTIWYDGFRANNKRYMEAAVKLGHDGVIRDIIDSLWYDENEIFIVVFNPNSIKINNISKVVNDNS